MIWVTYQGQVVNGHVALPPAVKLPEKATVLVTVLSEGVPADQAQDSARRTRQILLDEARAWREHLQARGVQTDSVTTLDEARAERLDDFDLH
jgi:hypothetical protein